MRKYFKFYINYSEKNIIPTIISDSKLIDYKMQMVNDNFLTIEDMNDNYKIDILFDDCKSQTREFIDTLSFIVEKVWETKKAKQYADYPPFTLNGTATACNITKPKLAIKQIYVNKKKRTTTVLFANGHVRIVKCLPKEKFDIETAIAYCIAHEYLGSHTKLKKLAESVKYIEKKGKK